MSKTLHEVYQSLAKKHSGSCRISKTTPENLSIARVSYWNLNISIPFHSGNLSIVFSEVSPTQTYYEFSKDVNLQFLIYNEDWLERFTKLFGSKEFEIGDKEFDNRYYIKGSDKPRLLKIFDKQVREFMLNNQNLANISLGLNDEKSILRIKAPFNESDVPQCERMIDFVKHLVSNIHASTR